jgi:hypothetical protein
MDDIPEYDTCVTVLPVLDRRQYAQLARRAGIIDPGH